MKFTSVSAFEKHLGDAAPDHLSHIYMVVTPVDFERRKIAETIIQAIEPDTTARFDAIEAPIERVVAQLNTLSLLGRRPLTILDNFDKPKKGELALLEEYLTRPSPFAYLILMAGSLKGHRDLYEKARSEAVLLDLTDEKPWEKEKRLTAYIAKEAARAGKTLEPSLAARLLADVGPDMATLGQELFKLISYVGSRSRITLEDAQAICSSYQSLTGWQLAEGIVWEGPAALPHVDTSFLIALIGQLRFHLQAGLQICEGGMPYYKPAQAEKFSTLSRKYGRGYFKKGLEALFEMELSIKSSGVSPDLLLDIFIAKLTKLKYAHSSSQSPRA